LALRAQRLSLEGGGLELLAEISWNKSSALEF